MAKKTTKKESMEFDIKSHVLVPEHIKLNSKEKKELLEKYHINLLELPKISMKDPALKNMDVNVGDVIKITRKSSTAGKSVFYRAVINT
jgi:DNA-directed RNA polymerase subunit H